MRKDAHRGQAGGESTSASTEMGDRSFERQCAGAADDDAIDDGNAVDTGTKNILARR